MANSDIWTDSEAIALQHCDLAELIEAVVDRHGEGSLLLVCSTKNAFLEELCRSTYGHCQSSLADNDGDDGDYHPRGDNELPPAARQAMLRHRLLQPTLHMLSCTKSLKVAFAPSVPHTLAYLTRLSLQPSFSKQVTASAAGSATRPFLVVLNPLNQYRDTRSFSAQGLSRFFSSSALAAQSMGAKLIVAECPSDLVLADAAPDEEEESLFAPEPQTSHRSIWDEETAMINVKTKTFGIGERGWQGRTVTCRRVAERWCTFVSL